MKRALPVVCLCICFLWSITGCKKHYVKKHFTGTFMFHDSSIVWPPTVTEVTDNSGTITLISSDQGEYTLEVEYRSGRTLTAVIDDDGNVLHGGDGASSSVTGEFINDDEVELKLHSQSPGGGHTHWIRGVRQ